MATIQYSAVRNKGMFIVSIGGSLDAQTAPALNNKFEDEIKKGPDIFVLNMSKIDYIASAGLGILISLNENLTSKKKELRLCEVTPKVKKIFKALGFDALFTFYDSEASAVKG